MPSTTRPLHLAALSIVVCLSIAGCAMKQDLTGGPRDATPASVVTTQPPTGTASYADDRVVFAFDDYVDRSVRNAVSVLPNVRFTTTYAGDELVVVFADSLAPYTTYTVTLGTDWADLRGNKPTAASTVVFSTGPQIDTGRIDGRVRVASPTSVMIFCYQRADTLDSDFSPRTTTPKYRLPIGSSGDFSLQGLPDGQYRVLAVRDENRNGLLDNTEEFVVAASDVDIRNGRTAPLSLLLGPAIDREPPTIMRVRAITSRRIDVTFSESVTPSTSWTEALHLTRGDAPTPVPIVAVLQDRRPTDRITLRLGADVDTSRHILLVGARSLVDSNGVVSVDSIIPTSFRGVAAADTTRLRIVSITPADSAANIGTDSAIVVVFSDAVDTTGVHATVWHEGPTGALPIAITWTDPRTMLIRPTRSRAPKTMYRSSITLAGVRSAVDSVLRDTTIVHHLRTEERRSEPGSIVGVVVDPSGVVRDTANLLLRILTAKNAVVTAMRIRLGLPFTVDALPPGTYGFDVIADRNGNGRYDHGDHSPFTFGESWWSSSTQVTVRSRWTVDDVRVVIDTPTASGTNSVR